MKASAAKGLNGAQRTEKNQKQMDMVKHLLAEGEITIKIIEFLASKGEFITTSTVYGWRRKLGIKTRSDYRKLNVAPRTENGHIKGRGPALMEPEEIESIILHRRLNQLMAARHNREARAS